MTDWLEHSVQIEVAAPMEVVWGLWANLAQMPRWMPWIHSVQILPEDASLSRWKLAASGLEFTWLSRVYNQLPGQIIEWESVDGLPNRGAVRFYDRKGSSIVRLSISYAIPGVLGKVMDNLFLGKAVERTLQTDMERFRDCAEQVYAASNAATTAPSSASSGLAG